MLDSCPSPYPHANSRQSPPLPLLSFPVSTNPPSLNRSPSTGTTTSSQHSPDNNKCCFWFREDIFRSRCTDLGDGGWGLINPTVSLIWKTCCSCSNAFDWQLDVSYAAGHFLNLRSPSTHLDFLLKYTKRNAGMDTLAPAAIHPPILRWVAWHIPKGRLFRTILHLAGSTGSHHHPPPLPCTHTQNPQSFPLPPNNTQPHVPAIHE